MSKRHPIIAVTGSSGAGTSSVRDAFEHIFFRERVTAAMIEGDSFHRYDRLGMRKVVGAALKRGGNISHFGPEANLLPELEALFREYGESGTGNRRHYVHDEQEAASRGQPPGTFTPWEPMGKNTDLLFYEGLHGGVVTQSVDVACHVDLLIGVVPIVNLEWIQKLLRDTKDRGYERATVMENILRRMYDYVHYITPQFSRTDINFQRVPTVDTSNPFIARDIPTLDESFVVIRFRDPQRLGIDFGYILSMIQGSFMSRRNTVVVPGGKMGFAIELVCTPVIDKMLRERWSTEPGSNGYARGVVPTTWEA